MSEEATCMVCGRTVGQHSFDSRDVCNMFIGPDNANEVVGHKTFSTDQRDQFGLPVFRHEPLTAIEGAKMWKAAQEAKNARQERMPDEQAAINALFEAWQRLKELGWNSPSYCPKDGSSFKVIELGSTGVFDCYYQGEWPDGLFMVSDEHDVYPTSIGVAMYRLYPEDEEKRKQKMREAGERYRAEVDALSQSNGHRGSEG